jgi:sugar lactone lactonase YvrE
MPLLRYHAGTTALLLTAFACGDREAAVTRAVPEKVGEISGLDMPESVRYDAARDVWYIANITGEPTARDSSGTISRVSGDLATVDTAFIAGGVAGVELHAPKGMTVVGDTLWVTDIDAVRGFLVTTGEVVATIAVEGARFLNDVAHGTDGALYVTDSGYEFGPSGMTQPGPDRVFRIVGRAVSEALRFADRTGPNGIAVDLERGRVLIVSEVPTIFSWTLGNATADSIASGPGGYDGVVVLGDGRVLISSWTDSAVHVFAGDSLRPFLTGLPSAADMGVDTTRGRLGVPLLSLGRVEFWTIPAR